MRRIVMSAALAFCLVAASMPLGAQGTHQVQPPTGFPAVGAPATVTLTSPGAEPRKLLRFIVANGHREHMTIDTAMTMTMAVGGNSTTETKMPVLRSGADLEVTAVSNTGDMTISMTFTDGKWIATPSSDPSMMTALNGAILALKGLSGTMVMSNRAFTRDATFDTSKVSNPQLSQAMAPIKQMLQNLSLPLPEGPVGVGATWEVRLGLNANGIQTFSRHSVEVTAMDDKSCTLKMAVEETAPPQSFSNPTIGGATMSVDAFNSTGSGTTKIQFDTLSPTSELNVNTKMTMSIDMGGNAQQMNMAMSMKSTITPGVK